MRITKSINRPDNVTTYGAGDVVGNTSSIISFGYIAKGIKKILGARHLYGEATVPAGMAAFNLHLYSSSPTNIADNAAYALASADAANYLGMVVLTLVVVKGATGAACFSQDDEVNMTIDSPGGSLYGLLETVGGYTPVAETVHTITLDIE